MTICSTSVFTRISGAYTQIRGVDAPISHGAPEEDKSIGRVWDRRIPCPLSRVCGGDAEMFMLDQEAGMMLAALLLVVGVGMEIKTFGRKRQWR